MGTNLPAPMPHYISKVARKRFARICIYFFGVMGLTLLFTPSLNATQQFGIPPFLPSQKSEAVTLALVLVAFFYGLIAFSLRGTYPATKRAKSPSWWLWLHPAVVSAGEYGEASISSLQLLWFTLIVFFIASQKVFYGVGLPGISQDIIALLGWPAASKLGSVAISNSRLRLSLENWNWLIDSNYLRQGNTIDPREGASFKHLILTDGTFDPLRFQLFVFSFLIGLAILLGNDISNFTSSNWNNFLVGSNAIYLGGKALAPSVLKELDERIDAIRNRKTELIEASTGMPEKGLTEDAKFIKKCLVSAFGSKALGAIFAAS